MSEPSKKPLGGKAYGSIGHLPSSRIGPGDHHVHAGQGVICTERARDKHDVIHIQEKLDGSCVAVARIGDGILPLTRAGYVANTSPYKQHHLFHEWAVANADRFLDCLLPGERLCGEWLAMAHGTRYQLRHDPFVAFDIIKDGQRMPLSVLESRMNNAGHFITPFVIHSGGPISPDKAMGLLGRGAHGALDPVEGVMYRVERKGAVDFLAKWVRPDKKDGCYLAEVSGQPEVWNWQPGEVAA